MAKKSKSDFLSWGVLIFLSIVWGSSYILIKKGLDVFTPQQVGLLRLSISALAFLPIGFFILNKIPKTKYLPLLLVAITGSGIPAFLFPFAQSEISSSLAGILNSLTPMFTLILGFLFFKLPFTWSKLLGVFLGLGGATFLVLQTHQSDIEGSAWHAILAILATISYGISSNTVKLYLQDVKSLYISAISFLMLGLPSLIFLFNTDFLHIMSTENNAWSGLGAVLVLALIGTVAATVLFFKLVQMTTAVFASTVAYLIPFVALLWGVIDGEFITFFHLAGMLLILSGIYILRKS